MSSMITVWSEVVPRYHNKLHGRGKKLDTQSATKLQVASCRVLVHPRLRAALLSTVIHGDDSWSAHALVRNGGSAT